MRHQLLRCIPGFIWHTVRATSTWGRNAAFPSTPPIPPKRRSHCSSPSSKGRAFTLTSAAILSKREHPIDLYVIFGAEMRFGCTSSPGGPQCPSGASYFHSSPRGTPSPILMRLLSSRLLHWRGAPTKKAFTIFPLAASKPASSRAASKCAKSSSTPSPLEFPDQDPVRNKAIRPSWAEDHRR